MTWMVKAKRLIFLPPSSPLPHTHLPITHMAAHAKWLQKKTKQNINKPKTVASDNELGFQVCQLPLLESGLSMSL